MKYKENSLILIRNYASDFYSLFVVFLLFFSALGYGGETTSFSQKEALEGPKWVREGIIYSMFLRNFSPAGDINSATERLDDLKQLGVTIVWLLPIHPIGQAMKKGTIGSPYSIQDYYALNSAYGTKEDFKNFVARAHQLGLKVIIDAVVNHTSWDNTLMKEPEFYQHDQHNRIIPPLPEWKDVAALDYNNPSLRSYVIEMLKYWLREFDLDGFRFDAASFVPLDFWEQVRRELLHVKADILLLGEQDSPEALVKAFDMDYDWKFEEVLVDVITNGAPATNSLKSVLDNEKAMFPRGALHLRFSDNHDKKRAIVRFGEKGALAASALIFTLDGVPLLYNGMEIGDTTESTDPALFEKLPIFWKTAEIRPEFIHFYQQMIMLRKTYPALREGEIIWLTNSDDARVVTFLRKTSCEEFLIAINFSNQPFLGEIGIEGTTREYVNLTPAANRSLTPPSQFNHRQISLKPWEYVVYKAVMPYE